MPYGYTRASGKARNVNQTTYLQPRSREIYVAQYQVLIGTFSKKLSELPMLEAFLGYKIKHLSAGKSPRAAQVQAVAGWGFRPTALKPRQIAEKESLPFIALEDGFIRSVGTGQNYPTLSLVVDELGIYYAGDRESSLEQLLQSDKNLFSGPGERAIEAFDYFKRHGLSKYNLSPEMETLAATPGRQKILVVDQTVGDASIAYGLADSTMFYVMLQAARDENPGALIYVKTHPEVNGGVKRGYLSDTKEDANTILLRENIAPASLLRQMDRVYVVTSHMGFEALAHGATVSCFGLPWYAGWGATNDRITCVRRTASRTVEELFSAAYLHYTRYINPTSLQPGTIFDVMEWMTLQRAVIQNNQGRCIAVGYRRWKAANVEPFLHPDTTKVHFVADASAAAAALAPTNVDKLIIWGRKPAPQLEALARKTGAKLHRMEDGFIRSVGLGSDFVAPHSLVIDSSGLYFDAQQASDLETILGNQVFNDLDISRATLIQKIVVENDLTKYNTEPLAPPSWAAETRQIILVPGQVEDDASILYGCGPIRDNLSLLRKVRKVRPSAFIVYKPHPDVSSRNRKGRLHQRDALVFCDRVETEFSIISCINASAEVHTMTSLSGFDALLRGVSVYTYGSPFYAGWGLTSDSLTVSRRRRRLTLEQLIAGSMIYYPTYWDWTLKGYTTCEASLQRILTRRDEVLRMGGYRSIKKTYLERQWHKLRLWIKAGFWIKK